MAGSWRRGFKLEISFEWVPHGSVLCPILFDLQGVISKILKFLDYTKLFRKIKKSGEKYDIITLLNWSGGLKNGR